MQYGITTQGQTADKLPQFLIEKITYTEELPYTIQQPKINAPYFRLLWITRSSCNFRIDMDQFDAADNCLFFIKPGQMYSLEKEKQVEGYLLSFLGSFMGIDADERSCNDYPGTLMQFFSKQMIMLEADSMTDIKEIMDRMLKEQNNIGLYQAEILKRFFKIFLLYLVRQFGQPEEINNQTGNIELVKRFMSLLEKDFLIKKMVSDYAAQLFLSANYLNQIVKKITGYSAGYHIRQRVMLEAKRKAVYSNKTMKEIAYLLGFSDPAHFSKFFKKTTGTNFISFRRDKLPMPYMQEM